MEKNICKICLEKFDHSLKRPLVLFRCGHTFCAQCVGDFYEKKCPICRYVIKGSTTNWSMLEGLPQSNYDKIKTDLEKEISEIDSIKSRLNELKEQKLQENIVRFESMKIQVRNQKKAFIKQINAEETKNLKIIEEKELKFKTELLNLAFFNENNISKQSLAENKLKEEELKNLKAELFKFKNSLNGKIEKLEKLKDGSNFILKIIQEMQQVQSKNTVKKTNKKVSDSKTALNLIGNTYDHNTELNDHEDLSVNKTEISNSTYATGHRSLLSFEGKIDQIIKVNKAREILVLKNQLIACGDEKGNIKILNPADGALIRIIKVHGNGHREKNSHPFVKRISSLVEMQDGRLVSGTGQNTIKIWNTSTGELIRTIENEYEGHFELHHLAISNKDKIASGSSYDNKITIWDANIGQKLKTIELNSNIRSLTALEGEQLACGLQNSIIQILNINNGEEIGSLIGHRGMIESLVALPGKKLASGSCDFTVRLWNTENYSLIHILQGHNSVISYLCLLKDGLTLATATGSSPGMIKLWNISTGKLKKNLKTDPVISFAALDDGRLISNSYDKLTIWH